jgi:hypothetical protein
LAISAKSAISWYSLFGNMGKHDIHIQSTMVHEKRARSVHKVCIQGERQNAKERAKEAKKKDTFSHPDPVPL